MSVVTISISLDVRSPLLAPDLAEGETLDEVHRNPTNSTKPSVTQLGHPEAKLASAGPTRLTYQLLDETYAAPNANEAMFKISVDLAQYDDNFFPKLADKVRGRTRNHVARSRSEVYPGRPDLAKSAREVAPGWFMGCNIANREKVKILRAACDVAGIVFGQDLKIDLTHA